MIDQLEQSLTLVLDPDMVQASTDQQRITLLHLVERLERDLMKETKADEKHNNNHTTATYTPVPDDIVSRYDGYGNFNRGTGMNYGVSFVISAPGDSDKKLDDVPFKKS